MNISESDTLMSKDSPEIPPEDIAKLLTGSVAILYADQDIVDTAESILEKLQTELDGELLWLSDELAMDDALASGNMLN